MKGEPSEKIIRKVFLAFVPVQALAVALPGINSLLNGLIVGSFLGMDALAAVGFVSPLIMIIGAVSAVMSSGAQILCGRYLGRGNVRKLRGTFTAAVLMSGSAGLLFSLLGFLFPTQLAILMGSTGTMTEMTARYILGMSPGFFFNVLFACVLPFLQMDNRKSASTAAVIASLITGVGFNLLNVFVLKWGLLGVGLSTAAGNLVSVLIGLPHFVFKSNTYRFSPADFTPGDLGSILKLGYPASVSSVSLALRDRVMNQILFSIGGSAAMSALTVANNMTATVIGINGGYGGSISLVSSVLAGERDIRSLRRLTRTAFKSIGWLFYALWVLLFVLAKPIARLFGAGPDTVALYAMTIRVVNLWLFTNPFKEAPLSLYRSMGKTRLTSLFFALNGFVFPVLVLTLLGKNQILIYATPVISEVLVILTYILYFRIRAHRFPDSLLNVTYIPESLGVSGGDRYAATIQSTEDAVRASREVCDFCRKKRLPERTAVFCGLCLEEIAMNTLKHGFPEKNRDEYAVDVRMIRERDGVSLMIRDNCPGFDPTEWLKMYAVDDPAHSIGLKLVSRIASRMEYTATLGLNVLNIRLDAPDT